MPTAKPKIYEAINGLMADVGAIGKNQENTHQRFKFRGIDDIYNALHPILVKHKVFALPKVLDVQRTERAKERGGVLFFVTATVEYTFYTEDGSSVVCVVAGEAMDSGDKATSKALSIAYKYALFQLLCIPTEETAADPDRDTHKPEPQRAPTPDLGPPPPAPDELSAGAAAVCNDYMAAKDVLELDAIRTKAGKDRSFVDSLSQADKNHMRAVYNYMKQSLQKD